MNDLLRKIDKEGIIIEVVDGELKLFTSKTNIDANLIQEIKTHRKELTDYISKSKNTAITEVKYFEIPKCQSSVYYPLSNAQYRLWVASQMEGGSTAYNISNQLVLDGSFDLNSFQKAIHSVIERHEILRTVFKSDIAGQVHQYVLSPEELNFTIPLYDFRLQPDPVVAARQYTTADYLQPFDLSQGPLLRAALLQLADEQYVFYYNLHHIISDGWSTGVLSRDVMHHYQAYVSGVQPQLPPLRIQYKDYAVWQLDQSESPAFGGHKDYWLSRLSTPIPPLDLPGQQRRPAVKTFGGKRIGTHLSAALTQQLRRLTSQTGGSLFMGLLAGWKVLLYRYTGQTDITVGNPVAGRDHPDLTDQIGFYINTLALRDELDPAQSFLQTYQAIKANTLEAYSHQMYPFDQLLEGLNLKRDISRNPLFDILIDYEGAAPLASPYQSLQEIGTGKVKFDLELDITEVADGLNLTLGYNTQVYQHQMVQDLLVHYCRLLEALLQAPHAPIGSISFLSPEQVHTLLDVFNPPVVAVPFVSLVSRFEQQVRLRPDAIALVHAGQQLTYQQLEERSSQLASYLSRQGVGADSLVGLHLDRSLDLLVGIVGILRAGAAYVPIDVDCPADRLAFMLEDAGCQVVVSQKALACRLDDYPRPLQLVCLDEPAGWSQPPPVALSPISPEQLAYVIYTSGTTGRPKGVMIQHGSLSSYLSHQSSYFGIEPQEAVLLFASVAFDASVEQMWLALSNGARLVIPRRSELTDGAALSRLLVEQQITHLHAVPSFLATLEVSQGLCLRRIVSAGEPFDMSLWSKWSTQLSLYNKYGPTEATISASEYQLTDASCPSSVGRPIGQNQCYVLGWQQTLQPVGVVGEICIGGAGLARGYLNQQELTQARFVAHPFQPGAVLYRTGDLGSWSADGSLHFHGRQDHQVKIRGYRIELEEIESVLNGLPNIDRSTVVAVADGSGSWQLVAFVVCREVVDGNSLREGLMLLLEEQLPSYMVPQHYVKLEWLPLTAGGKVDRSRLPIPESLSRHQPYVAPVTQTEQSLAGIWQQVLGVAQVGLHDNFFELGGNSLNAIKLSFAMVNMYQVKVEMNTIFKYPTLQSQSQYIDLALMSMDREKSITEEIIYL